MRAIPFRMFSPFCAVRQIRNANSTTKILLAFLIYFRSSLCYTKQTEGSCCSPPQNCLSNQLSQLRIAVTITEMIVITAKMMLVIHSIFWYLRNCCSSSSFFFCFFFLPNGLSSFLNLPTGKFFYNLILTYPPLVSIGKFILFRFAPTPFFCDYARRKSWRFLLALSGDKIHHHSLDSYKIEPFPSGHSDRIS